MIRMIYGAIVASIALWIIANVPVPALGTIWPAIVVGVTVFFLQAKKILYSLLHLRQRQTCSAPGQASLRNSSVELDLAGLRGLGVSGTSFERASLKPSDARAQTTGKANPQHYTQRYSHPEIRVRKQGKRYRPNDKEAGIAKERTKNRIPVYYSCENAHCRQFCFLGTNETEDTGRSCRAIWYYVRADAA